MKIRWRLPHFRLLAGILAIGAVLLLAALLFRFNDIRLLEQQSYIHTRMAHLIHRAAQLGNALHGMEMLTPIRADRFQLLLKDMTRNLNELDQVFTDPQLDMLIERIRQQLQHHRQLIDHALRQQSVLTAIYPQLPTLNQRCIMETGLNDGFLMVLLQSPIRANTSPDSLNPLFQQLPRWRERLPDRPACRQFDRHVTTYLLNLAALRIDLRRLNLTGLEQLIETLSHRFDQLMQQHIQRQKTTQTGLLVVLLLFGTLLILALVMIDGQLRQLQQRERALEKLNRLYRALSGINEALIRAEDRATLYARSCQVMIDTLQALGVVILDSPDERGLLYLRCIRLKDDAHLSLVKANAPVVAIDPNLPEGRGITGEAWRTGRVQIVQDYLNDPRTTLWQPLAQQLNINSAAAIPLRRHNHTEAVMLVFHHDTRWFDEDIISLLEEIGEDLSFALERLALLEAQRQQRIQLELAEVAFNTHEGIAISDSHHQVIRSNDALRQMGGYTHESLLGRPLETLLESETPLEQILDTLTENGHWQGELQLRRYDGSLLPIRASLTQVKIQPGTLAEAERLGQQRYIVLQAQDISQLRALEDALEQTRRTDSVTGLPNRTGMLYHLQQVLTHVMPEDSWGILSIFNLRHFKAINDSFGHEGGDELLRQVAERLRDRLSFPHLTARDANDEFALLPLMFYPDQSEALNAWQVLFAEVEQCLTAPFSLQEHQVQVEIYAGTTVFSSHTVTDSEVLLNQAETALRSAKSRHNQIQAFYDGESNRAAQQLVTLRHALEQALNDGSLLLHYQPITDARTGQTHLAEALIRWRRDGELVPPGQFIPVLEHSPRLMIRTGHWIIRTACLQCAQISQALNRSFGVSINLSAIQFSDPDLHRTLTEAVSQAGIRPQQITLEVTESALMDNLDNTATQLARLAAEGFGIAIDDFGTGYASLQYLQRLSANKLKLDKTFVDAMEPDERQTLAIPGATIAMAHALDMRVVAEGVETAAQLALLQTMDCDLIQGYHIARPMELEALIQWLKHP